MADKEQALLNDIFSVSEVLYREMSDTVPDAGHDNLYEAVTRLGKTLSLAERTCFWKWDRRTATLWTQIPELGETRVIPETAGYVGRALAEKRIIFSNNPARDPVYGGTTDLPADLPVRSVMVLPVANVNGEYIGAFQAVNRIGGDGVFTQEDYRRLSLAAVLCGIALESENFLDASHHDQLTQLKNRMGFYSDFMRDFQQQIAEGRQISLFICDIDKFKQINDTYGHSTGDAVLQHTADILASCCRPGDAIYRWGGEEFVMVLSGADVQACAEKAEEIRMKVMESVCMAENNEIRLTLSFGAAAYDPEKSVEENLTAADEKLYTAKESGRNRVVY